MSRPAVAGTRPARHGPATEHGPAAAARPPAPAPGCFFIATSWHESAISHHFRALADVLAARGHRVVLLVDGRRTDVERHDGNPAIHTWPSRRPVHLRDARFLYALVRARRPDCIVANFGSINLAMLVGRALGVPARVAWYHTLSTQIDMDVTLPRWAVRLLRRRKRAVYACATRLVANSAAARDDLARTFGVDERRCEVFHNALADPLTRPAVACASEQRRPRIVCAGRLYPTKGQDVLVRALALLAPRWPALTVEFAGDGPEREPLAQLARRLGVAERCTFAGDVAHEVVLTRMAGALAVATPSRTEAFGVVNIEALAVGTPVVASRVGGIGEIVRDGVDGFLVPPDDPEALAARIEALLRDPEAARTMGAQARQRFLDAFEQRAATERQVAWLERIALGAAAGWGAEGRS